jgi:hypothetical protein
MKTKYLGQNKIQSEYQGMFWHTFFAEDSIVPEESWLMEFVHSDNFRKSIRQEAVKQPASLTYPFLKGGFNLSNLDVTNFKVFNKAGLVDFFNEYAQSDDWGEDRAAFIAIMDEFNRLLEKQRSDKFFLISKEWFSKGDPVLNQDSEIYLYYFLIIWIDIDKGIVNVCEWDYD